MTPMTEEAANRLAHNRGVKACRLVVALLLEQTAASAEGRPTAWGRDADAMYRWVLAATGIERASAETWAIVDHALTHEVRRLIRPDDAS